MAVVTYNLPDIHQGPAWLWYNVALPAIGERLLISATGEPTQGSPVFMGAIEGATKITMKRTLEEVKMDQKTAPVDVIITAEEADVSCVLKQSQLALLAKVFGPTYASGTDTGLPAGAQAYEEIAQGGLVTIPQAPVAVISPRRGFSSPGKHFVFVLYKAFGIATVELNWTRTKETTYTAHFKGLSIADRAWPDDLCKLYIQS